ncbi:MAG: glycoside hydrolase family 16 protein [Opitutus sp.]
MKPTMLRLMLQLGVAFCPLASPGHAADDRRLIWSDEFDGAINSAPNSAHWIYDEGGKGWGNQELQTYTRATENASLIADANAADGKALVLRALRGSDGKYTSARLKTLGKFVMSYGKIEARLRTTNGKGIWPAFWMLGENISTVGWPKCGEIDVVEVINANPDTVYGTLHGPGYSGPNALTGKTRLQTGTLDQAYHVYSIEWSPDRIEWFFDGAPYHTATPASLPAGARWVFNDAPFIILVNLAVGGNWPGPPDETTPFPQTLTIDYIRVFAAGKPPR